MQSASVSRSMVAHRRVRFDAGVAGIWMLAFALPLYLALEGGGYDGVVRGEIGIAVWWAIIVGCAVGILPWAKPTRAGWAAIALLAAFAAWSLLTASWSSSSERSVFEAARLATHLGVLVLGVVALRREAARHVVHALAAAVAVVGAVALLSRLQPAWFPTPRTGEFLPGLASRLSYPLNYWNALGAFLAMGVPLLLFIATSARTVAARAAGAAALPIVASSLYLTYSRGSLLALAVALVVLFAAWPARLGVLATAAVGATGSVILAASIAEREALADATRTDLAIAQGHQVVVLALLVMAGCALLQVAVTLVERHVQRPRALRPSPRVLGAATALLAMSGVLVAVGAGVPAVVSDGWERFKSPDARLAAGQNNTAARLTAASGKGRYQYWESAVNALESRPLSGIGAGTFEFWWAERATTPGFVRNAHSLWFESAAEAGLVGLALLVGVLAVALLAGLRRLRGASMQRRVVAAALAALAAFCTSASFDWIWQVTVVPVMALLLVAALVSGDVSLRSGPRTWRIRAPLIALGIAALALIAVPLAGLASVRESQSHAQRDEWGLALSRAADAREVQPYAATAATQQALLYEQVGAIDDAIAAARQAVAAERTNWRTWLVLSRVLAEGGDAKASVAAYRQARSLNPNSRVFR